MPYGKTLNQRAKNLSNENVPPKNASSSDRSRPTPTGRQTDVPTSIDAIDCQNGGVLIVARQTKNNTVGANGPLLKRISCETPLFKRLIIKKMTENQESVKDIPLVLQDLRRFLSNKQQDPPSLFDTSAMAVPVAAISALLGVVERSQAETMMGLQDDLKNAADCMIQNHPQIAVRSGCELFLRYSTRTFLELPNFSECKKQILERGERFQMISLAARDRIALAAADFIPAGATVMTTGWSRVVAAILREAKNPFDLIILEGRPDASGAKAAACYARESNIPVKVILDSAIAYYMEKVDLVLVGAEGVLENGGVVNKLGTAAMAMCAKANGKPFYVAAESYKFARLYPLHQSDVPVDKQEVQFVDTNSMKTIELDEKIGADNPSSDFTPAKYISLLFTDLGVLTPSAVSDELIRLYQ